MPEFKIYYKKGEDPISLSYPEDTLIEDIFKDFSGKVKKDLKDLVFYYKGSQIKYGNSEKINKSIFKAGDKDFNIFAVSLTTISSEKVGEKEEEDLEDKENPEGDTEKEKKERLKVDREKYNDIICPYCKTSAIIDKRDNTNYGLKILNCKNFHYGQEISYDEYENYVVDFVLIDKEKEILKKFESKEEETDEEKKEREEEKKRWEEKINNNKQKYNNMKEMFKCQLCSNVKESLSYPKDKFFICNCGSVICETCHSLHKDAGINHHMIDIDDKNYFCIKHGKKFESYCIDCNDNICKDCEKFHPNHDIKSFKDIKVKKTEIEKLSSEIEKQKKNLLDFITKAREELEEKLKTIEDYANNYIKIENTLIKRYESYFWNYQLLRNLKNKSLFQNEVTNKLKEILNSYKNLDEIFPKINEICTDIKKAQKKKNSDKHSHSIDKSIKYKAKIKYKIYEEKPIDRRVRLFDEIFVKNNKDILSLTVNGNQQDELKVYYENTDDKIKELEVTLKEKPGRNIIDMSYMFNNCKNFSSFEIINGNTNNIFSMEAMFQLCTLNKIPQIAFNTQNLENIRAMFCKCINLVDISSMNLWFQNQNKNNNKLNNISMLFNGCINMKAFSFPKMENHKQISDISYLFNRCRNLTDINDMDKLKVSNVTNMAGLFNGCVKLKYPKEINSWNTQNVRDMSIVFQNCKSMQKIDFKWNMENLIKMNGLFSQCSSLTSLSKNFIYSNIANVEEMVGVFNECNALEAIPELKYVTGPFKVQNLSKMFNNCRKLNSLPSTLVSMKFSNQEVFMKGTFNGCNDNDVIKNVKRNWERYMNKNNQKKNGNQIN